MWIPLIALLSLLKFHLSTAQPLLDCRADVGFVLDSSGSVGGQNWALLLRFLQEFVSHVSFSPEKMRVGVVTFGQYGHVDIAFDQCQWSDCFRLSVSRLPYLDEITNTSGGILTARTQLFSPEAGDRPDAPNLMVLITDGQATVDKNRTIPEALLARRKGIQMVAVGIGNDVDREELLKIVNNQPRNVLHVRDFTHLLRSIGILLNSTCRFFPGSTTQVISTTPYTMTPAQHMTPKDTQKPSQETKGTQTTNQTTTTKPLTTSPNQSSDQPSQRTKTTPTLITTKSTSPKITDSSSYKQSTVTGTAKTSTLKAAKPTSATIVLPSTTSTRSPSATTSQISSSDGSLLSTTTSSPVFNRTSTSSGISRSTKSSTSPTNASPGLTKASTNSTKDSTLSILSSTDSVKASTDSVKALTDSVKASTDSVKTSTDSVIPFISLAHASTVSAQASTISSISSTSSAEPPTSSVKSTSSAISSTRSAKASTSSSKASTSSAALSTSSVKPSTSSAMSSTSSAKPSTSPTKSPSTLSNPPMPISPVTSSPKTTFNTTSSSTTLSRSRPTVSSSQNPNQSKFTTKQGVVLSTFPPIPPSPCENVDFILLLDSSGSVQATNWDRLKEVAMVLASAILGETTRVGVVSFSSEAFLNVQLGSIDRRSDLVSAIDGIPWISQMTNISGALRIARRHMYGTVYDRPDAENVVLMLTDGRANRDIEETEPEAERLKVEARARIFVVGIGPEVDVNELHGISSDPDMFYMMLVPDYAELTDRKEEIFVRTCMERPWPVPKPRLRGECPYDLVFVLSNQYGDTDVDALSRYFMIYSVYDIDFNTHRLNVISTGALGALKYFSLEYRTRVEFYNFLDQTSNVGPTQPVDRDFNQALQLLRQSKRLGLPGPKVVMIIAPAGIDKRLIPSLENDVKKAQAEGIYVYVITDMENNYNDLRRVVSQPAEFFISSVDNTQPMDICSVAGPGTVGCDFETIDGTRTLCDLTQSMSDDFDWTLQSGRTPSRHTGPEKAYTGSYYIYVEASLPRVPGEAAELMFPVTVEAGFKCLMFYYHMKGWHVGRLEVVLRSPTRGHDRLAWLVKGPQASQWKMGMVTLMTTVGDRVLFRAIIGGAFSGDIALDSIRMNRGACPAMKSANMGLVIQ